MARKLKAGESVTVDRVVDFGGKSEPYQKGLTRVEPGQVGSVVGPAPQGRFTIVDFGGVQAAISNQRLERVEKKQQRKRPGRKPKASQISKSSPTTSVPLNAAENIPEDTSDELVTMIANTLLLNGGLKEDAEAVIQLRFTDLPDKVKGEIRELIDAKLALNRSLLKK